MGKNLPTIVYIHGGETHKNMKEYGIFLQKRDVDPHKKVLKRPAPCIAELEKKEYTVIAPSMPLKGMSNYTLRSLRFEKHIPYFGDSGVVFIGYSLGGVFLAKRLQNNTLGLPIQQLHIVASPYDNRDLVDADLCTFQIRTNSLENVESQTDQIHIYQSQDDPYVPWSHFKQYCKALPSASQHTFEDRNHFFQADFPELLQNIYHTNT